MARRILGIETEYGFTPLGRRGLALAREPVLGEIMKLARARLPHLPDLSRAGLFLGNGARFYVDVGMHPEMSTPECTDPWEVVRYVRAGDLILQSLGQEVASGGRGLEVLFFRGNVDYSGTRSTWGCHESYLHRSDPRAVAEQLVPHLVSRIIFTGAGGFDPCSPGLEFNLAPRSCHITQTFSSSSTNDRAIVHTKDEPLAGHGYRRLHLICGNSLSSETALWLMVATTALVVALAESGEAPGSGVRLADPLAALHVFARDPACRAEVALAEGGSATALALQRHYLERAVARLDAGFMPDWAEEACRRWREVLDHLEQGTGEPGRTLDWAIKHALYEDRIRRRGFDRDQIRIWNQFVSRHALTIAGPGPDPGGDDLTRFLTLRQEMFEIDTRFGQLGDGGIFSILDRAGVLRHRVVDPADIERARDHPPEGTRARIRGAFIRGVWGDRRPRGCTWEGIWDMPEKRLLNLSDPFAQEERWEPAGKGPPAPPAGPAVPARPVDLSEASIARQVADILGI